MFWVYDDLESLAPRLDSRVDKMVEVRFGTKASTLMVDRRTSARPD